MSFKAVIGIETHIELKTANKIFCGCKASFGDKPNTNFCPVCSGQKGAKPKLNPQVVDYAIKAGLALNCKVNLCSSFDRKHYVYHDLPKGYQITQYTTPICQDGFIKLDSGKVVRINRIHIEEDTCKSTYINGKVEIDYNRSGIPLIEIVTEPDMSSQDEAGEFVEKLQTLIRYTGVSDCKMNQGSLRCDINLSLSGERAGDRVEIKNLNGIKNIKKAIASEIDRQTGLLKSGQKVLKQTLKFDEKSGNCIPMRDKENSEEYNYQREPDLPILIFEHNKVEKNRVELGELPDKKYARFVKEHLLPEQTAKNLCKYKSVAEYFDKCVKLGADAKTVAKLITSTIFTSFQTEEEKENFDIKVTSQDLAKLSNLVEQGYLFNKAQLALEKMLKGENLDEIVSPKELTSITKEELMKLCTQAVQLNTQAVQKFKGGNCSAINALYGYVVKNASGKVDMGALRQIIDELIRE